MEASPCVKYIIPVLFGLAIVLASQACTWIAGEVHGVSHKGEMGCDCGFASGPALVLAILGSGLFFMGFFGIGL